MKTFMFDQGTPEWLNVRAGLATASNFGRIITDKKMDYASGAKSYIYEIIAEKLIGGPDPWEDNYQTADMRRGTRTEHEARGYHEMETGKKVSMVGFCIHDNERWGCSPDGLIDDDGGLELKCPAPKTQIRWLVDGGLPDEHRAQVYGSMIVTGRTYWNFLSYCIGLPPIFVRVERDMYMMKLLECLKRFNEEYDAVYAKVLKGREAFINEIMERREKIKATG